MHAFCKQYVEFFLPNRSVYLLKNMSFWWVSGYSFLPKNECRQAGFWLFYLHYRWACRGWQHFHFGSLPASVHIWVIVSEIRKKMFEMLKSISQPFVPTLVDSVSLSLLSSLSSAAVWGSISMSSSLVSSYPWLSISY